MTLGYAVADWFFGVEAHRSAVNAELAVYLGPITLDAVHYFGVREAFWCTNGFVGWNGLQVGLRWDGER